MNKTGAKTPPSAEVAAARDTESIKPSPPSRPKSQPSNEVDLEIAKMVQQKDVMASSPRKRTAEEPVVLHIWDFAGHDLYYTTHQVRTTNKNKNHPSLRYANVNEQKVNQELNSK